MTECKLGITSNWLIKTQEEQILQDEYDQILEKVNARTKRSMALHIKSLRYTLNKQEFQDSICLTYDWRIPNAPSYC